VVTTAEDRRRLFVGLELRQATRIELAGLVAPFRDAEGMRWVRSEDYHLTLRFIGTTANDRVPTMLEVIGRIATRARRCHIEVGGFDSFPGGRRPARVLVARVEDTGGGLADLASAVAAGLPGRAAGVWTPHITLGRCVPPRRVPQGWTSVHAELGRREVGQVALFASRPGTGGPRYEVLRVAPLGG
jgi:2'-5' RNA ligase